MKTWTLHIHGDAHLGVGHPIIAEVNRVHGGGVALLGQLKVRQVVRQVMRGYLQS